MNDNRIAVLRRTAGLSQEQLAERLGTGRSQIVKLERGERRLTVDWMVRIGRALGCDPAMLMPAAGPAAVSAVAGPGAPSMPRDLPVVGAARGGTDALFLDQGHPLERVERPPGLAGVGNAFAVYAVGDSMEPKYRSGDLLFVNPNLPPVRDGFVVVELGDQEAYVKQFVRRSGGEVILREFCPAQREFAVPAARIKAIYRVVGSWEGR